MQPLPSVALAFILLCVPSFLAAAGDSTDSAQTAAKRAEIERLESRLEDTRQTLAELEAELTAARKELAGMQGGAAVGEGGATTDSDGANERVATGLAARRPAPGSVTRLDTGRLAFGQVEDLSRLEFLTPGLRYGQTGHDARFSMRGARTNSIGPEAASVVGVFEDGVYVPTSTARVDSLLDVERVEVLRGPQITTFGQHAYAGAISIVTNKPDFDGIHGYAEGENAIPDRTRWRLALNVPISDTLALRFAGLSESRSGYIDNFFLEPDSDDLNDRKEQTLRSSVYWQPTDSFSVLFWRRFQDENGTGTAPWGYQQIGAYVDGDLVPGHQFALEGAIPDEGPWSVYRNFISASQYEHELNTLDVNWDMGVGHVQWLSHYTRLEGSQTYDSDFSSAGDFTSSAFAGWSTDEDGWSSELRLTSNGDGPLEWLVGLYASDRDAEWGWLEAVDGVFRQPAWDVPGKFSAATKAAFVQAGYPLGERLRLTGGLRWNEDEKTLKSGEKGSWDKLLWKAALEFDIDERMTGYLSASTGYLAGGINTAPGVNPTWAPEELTAYEAGLKAELARGLQLNLSAWYNDFDDVQSQSFLVLPSPAPEATEFTGNGGGAEARGVEAEIAWSPLPEWNLSAQLAYTDANFKDYIAPAPAGLGDLGGRIEDGLLSFQGWRPALSPEWVVGLQTSYTFHFRRWGSLTPYLQSTYASEYYASDLNLAGVRQDSHTRTDFRLIWQPTGRIEIQLYYLNLENEATLNRVRVYNPAARPDIATLQANWNNPDSNGIIFRYRF